MKVIKQILLLPAFWYFLAIIGSTSLITNTHYNELVLQLRILVATSHGEVGFPNTQYANK